MLRTETAVRKISETPELKKKKTVESANGVQNVTEPKTPRGIKGNIQSNT